MICAIKSIQHFDGERRILKKFLELPGNIWPGLSEY